MDVYTFPLVLGGAGLLVMAITGAAHLGRGVVHSHAGRAAVGHTHTGNAQGRANQGYLRGQAVGIRTRLLALASPRVIFSLLLGFGLAGNVAQHRAAEPYVPFIAVLGAVVFEWGLVTPVWNFAFRFASRPAETLDMSTFAEARATSAFNAAGEGIVMVEVDGQLVQCLGTLRDSDRALGVRVRSGDVVRVEAIDSARQRCTVSYVRHRVWKTP